MTKNSLALVFFGLLSLLNWSVAQDEVAKDSLPDEKVEQVKGMVNAMEYYFNLLGSKRTATSEKEVIIQDSYTKLFLDAQVQVEDDLEEVRSTVIFKDVQAYLKDIDFFFKDAVFDFEITEVSEMLRPDSSSFYMVNMIRNLQAVTLEGDSITTTQPRFVELNFDEDRELKIVSVYTKKLSRDKQLREWWGSLTLGWKRVFQDHLGVFFDSLSNAELVMLGDLDSLNLSGNELILDLEPVYQLTNLKYLKLTNTWVNDLKPLRSINTLKTLDVSSTSVFNLEYLKYHTEIETLDLRNCHVEDFSLLKEFGKLKNLTIAGITAIDLSFINHLKGLEYLDLSEAQGIDGIDFSRLTNLRKLLLNGSDVTKILGIGRLANLQEMNLGNTALTSLAGFEELQSLEILDISSTNVNSLEEISSLKSIKKVYADNTPIEESSIEQFLSKNPERLVIKNSDELMAWWQGMSDSWQKVLTGVMGKRNPKNEDLIRLTRIESLDLTSADVRTLEPLRQLKRVSELTLDNNQLTSLKGIEALESLGVISLNSTYISDLSPLKRFAGLKKIAASDTRVARLDGLENLNNLQELNVDNTLIKESEAQKFLESNSRIKLLFQSKKLAAWWSGLSEVMQRAIKSDAGFTGNLSSQDLHDLAARKSVVISGVQLAPTDLLDLTGFYRLESLKIERAGLRDVNDLPDLPFLKTLELVQMPIEDFTPILKYTGLLRLNISNTALDDLEPITSLRSLEVLNFSGTTLKRMDGIQSLKNLKEVDCSNTRIFRLIRLHELDKLEKLICFNTPLRENDFSKLREYQPDIEVVFY